MNSIKGFLKTLKAFSVKAINRAKVLKVKFSRKAVKTFKISYRFTLHNVIRPGIAGFKLFIKRAPRVCAGIIVAVALATSTATVCLATNATAAYDVAVEGKSIATVLNQEVLAEAEILATKKLNNPQCNKLLVKASLCGTVTSAKNLVSAEQLANILIANSDNIVKATLLYIDNTEVAAENQVTTVTNEIENYLSAYKQETGSTTVKISENVTYKDVYTAKSSFENLPTVSSYISQNADTIPVETLATVTEVEEIDFETVSTKSSKYAVGTKIVTKEGVKGTKEVTYEVSTANGEIVSKTEISSKVITPAVNKEVIEGTKRTVAEDTESSYSMLWPVKRVSRSYVSSYLGDGRGHKGMDICAPSGTPIYAAESGTVVSSGWDSSGYGYKIVIKHSGELSTLYAHCSALYVKAGDQVARGETIGAVGTTGRSTGNHLHFEVHKNGSYVSPTKYIGSN